MSRRPDTLNLNRIDTAPARLTPCRDSRAAPQPSVKNFWSEKRLLSECAKLDVLQQSSKLTASLPLPVQSSPVGYLISSRSIEVIRKRRGKYIAPLILAGENDNGGRIIDSIFLRHCPLMSVFHVRICLEIHATYFMPCSPHRE